MKTRARLSFLALAGVLGVVILALLFLGGEPAHKGLPLDYWTTKLKVGNHKEQAEAREAIRAMGASAVPHLTEALFKKDSPAKLWILNNYGRRFAFLYRVMPRTLDNHRAFAASALGEIGPAASNAIPALVRMSQTNLLHLSAPATAALMKIRGESIAPLIQDLDNLGSGKWQLASFTLAEFGTNARPAVPALCRALTSKNRQEWEMAAYALGYIHSDAALAVPALTKALMEGKLGNTIWALGEFEGEARSAVFQITLLQNEPNTMVRQQVWMTLRRILPPDEQERLVPLLVKGVSDPDPYLRGVAGGMLKEIAPDAAAKAGVK